MRSVGNFEVLHLSDKKKWQEFISQLPTDKHDVYYTHEYYRLYKNLGDGEARCFVYYENGDLAMYPFLINTVNLSVYNLNKRYYDIQGAYGYNGVISSSNASGFIQGFYRSFNIFCADNGIIAEFTRFHPLLNNHLFSSGYLEVIPDRKTVYIDLADDYASIFSRFQTTTRKQIKRAVNRYHLEVKEYENDPEIVDDFLPVYHQTMDRIKSERYLYFNKDYFVSLMKNIPSVCFVAYHQEQPIAAIIAFSNNHFMHGHLGGALTDYLSMSPFSLLYTAMIQFGIRKGCRYLHVGGGTTGALDDNLLNFKLNFSKNVAGFYIGKRIHNQTVYNEVVRQWGEKFPQKQQKYTGFLLKYRDVD